MQWIWAAERGLQNRPRYLFVGKVVDQNAMFSVGKVVGFDWYKLAVQVGGGTPWRYKLANIIEIAPPNAGRIAS